MVRIVQISYFLFTLLLVKMWDKIRFRTKKEIISTKIFRTK